MELHHLIMIRKSFLKKYYKKNITIEMVAKYLQKKRGRYLKATLYKEFINIRKLQNQINILKENTPITEDICCEIITNYIT